MTARRGKGGTVPIFYFAQEFTDVEFGCTTPDTDIGPMMAERRMFDADGHGSDFPPEPEPDDNMFVRLPNEDCPGSGATMSTSNCGSAALTVSRTSGNLCIESHLRAAVEEGSEMLAVTGATAAPSRGPLGERKRTLTEQPPY